MKKIVEAVSICKLDIFIEFKNRYNLLGKKIIIMRQLN